MFSQVWDLGGQTSIRPYWRCYFPNTDAIIFVVDSADPDRMEIAKQELKQMLEVELFFYSRSITDRPNVQEEELKDTILLVFANKQDMRGAYSAAQVSEAMDLASIRGRQWIIQETSASKGKGLFEGFDWYHHVTFPWLFNTHAYYPRLVTCIQAKQGTA